MTRQFHHGFLLLAALLAAAARAGELPDIGNVPMDLVIPPLTDGPPAAGKRVNQALPRYQNTRVHHILYLPADWQPGSRYPVIFEYAGNGPYQNKYGDTSSGRVEDCQLGYGISGGRGFIWICLPYVSVDHQTNQLQWWGDLEATVAYCKEAAAMVCQDFGGDPRARFIAGFSRGAIACNYVGLHDDEIAALWRGFICHSHYDGVRQWKYEGSDRQSAARRLRRLKGRPQFICHEGTVEETRQYLQTANPEGRFEFMALPYRNHTASWVLRDIPERKKVRDWIAGVLAGR